MAHCTQYPAVNRDYLHDWNWYLAHRTSYDSAGRGIHGGRHTEHFQSSFLTSCDYWASGLNYLTSTFAGHSFAWIGDVGVGFCKSGMHGQARAMDLTHIRFTSGQYIDMNWSWRQTLLHKRRYLGVVVQCRRYVGTVLTRWYNTAHHDHIHFDNGTAVTYIRTGVKTDTTHVQASCNLINGESLTVDGTWGSLTEAAYGRLINKLNMGCYNPKGNTEHARFFFELIARHCFANVSAGYYQAAC